MMFFFGEGRLAKDATVFTYGPNGSKKAVQFGLISDKSYNSDLTTYFNCVIWNRDERLAQWLKQGNQLIVFGEINIQRDETGQNWPTLEVKNFKFGSKKQGNRQNQDVEDQQKALESMMNMDDNPKYNDADGYTADEYGNKIAF